MRQALGTAVYFGMLGVTGFGLFLTPVFYVVIMWFKERRDKRRSTVVTQAAPPLTTKPVVT
jgi:multidrug efflux pump